MLKKLRLIVLPLAAGALVLIPAGAALAQNDVGDAAGAAAGLGFGVFGLVCTLVWIALVVALLVFWIMMLVDCVKREESQFPGSTGSSKTLWLVIVILLGWIGALVYYFMIKKKAPLPKT